jgi:hypothetical protein
MTLMGYLSSRILDDYQDPTETWQRLCPCYWRAPGSDDDSENFLSNIDIWKNAAIKYLHEVDAEVEGDHPRHEQVQQVIQRLEKVYNDLFSSRLPVRHGHDNLHIVSMLETVWQTRLQRLPPVPSEHKRYWLRDGYAYYVADPKLHVGYIDVKCAYEMNLNDVKELVQAVVFQRQQHRLSRLMTLHAPEGTLLCIHNKVDNHVFAVTAFDAAGRSVSLHENIGSVQRGIHSFK